MIWFLIGREFKLCTAEILKIFNGATLVYNDRKIVILDNLKEEVAIEKLQKMWGTIKAFKVRKVLEGNFNEFPKSIFDEVKDREGKISYGVTLENTWAEYKTVLMKIKKYLKEKGLSSRFINKDFKAITTAQIKWEKLLKKGTDFNFVNTDEGVYFWETIWVQDIDGYSERDYSKKRDMQIWMLPPKLSQIMINLSGGDVIYDPFVGLGTVLIEAVNWGSSKVFGSDLSDRMVETADENLKVFKDKKSLNYNFDVFKLNAKFIEEKADILKEVDWIVTEGYLWEVMTQKNISIDRIEKQKESLKKIYSRFFSGLKRASYKGKVVISFPFWEFKKKYFYFNEGYEFILENFKIEKLDLWNLEVAEKWSLLYKRNNQLVWREIFVINCK